MLPRVILVCALCAYHALTIEKARQLLEAAMQYAGHRRAVEKALDEVKALQAKERAAAEKLAEEEAKQRAVEKARLVLLASRYVLTMCLTACVRYAPCTYYVLAVRSL